LQQQIVKCLKQIIKGTDKFGNTFYADVVLEKFETILIHIEKIIDEKERDIFYTVFDEMFNNFVSGYFESEIFKKEYTDLYYEIGPSIRRFSIESETLKLIILLSKEEDLQRIFKKNIRQKLGLQNDCFYTTTTVRVTAPFSKRYTRKFQHIINRYFGSTTSQIQQRKKTRTLRSVFPPTITRASLLQSLKKGTKQQQQKQQKQPIDVTQKQISQIKKSVMEERWDFIKWLASKGLYWKDLTPLQRRRVENLVAQKYIITD
jgi:hypothetical protein